MTIKQISDNFEYHEVVDSDVASRCGISNELPDNLEENVLQTARGMEDIRAALGNKPIDVLSWYRSPQVNKLARGSKSSQHCLGQAVDFRCRSFGTPRDIVQLLAKSGISFDQLILEFDSWVHVSFCEKPRRQVLTAVKEGGATVYKKGIQ